MGTISQMELSAIREVATCHKTCACKLRDYAQKCKDPQVVQMFSKAADDADKAAQNLANML